MLFDFFSSMSCQDKWAEKFKFSQTSCMLIKIIQPYFKIRDAFMYKIFVVLSWAWAGKKSNGLHLSFHYGISTGNHQSRGCKQKSKFNKIDQVQVLVQVRQIHLKYIDPTLVRSKIIFAGSKKNVLDPILLNIRYDPSMRVLQEAPRKPPWNFVLRIENIHGNFWGLCTEISMRGHTLGPNICWMLDALFWHVFFKIVISGLLQKKTCKK